MSALRMAELILGRAKERLEENHKEMDKGKQADQYQRLVGKNQEVCWIQYMPGVFFSHVVGE